MPTTHHPAVAHFTQNEKCAARRETTIIDASGPRGGIDRIPSICDERDCGHWYPKSRVFLLWTVAHLTDTGLAGRDSIWRFVGLTFFGWVQGLC
jgi:hypothetical protein